MTHNLIKKLPINMAIRAVAMVRVRAMHIAMITGLRVLLNTPIGMAMEANSLKTFV
jgi:hypothetical protein